MKILKMIWTDIKVAWIYTGIMILFVGLWIVFGKDGIADMLKIIDKEYDRQLNTLKGLKQ